MHFIVTLHDIIIIWYHTIYYCKPTYYILQYTILNISLSLYIYMYVCIYIYIYTTNTYIYL